MDKKITIGNVCFLIDRKNDKVLFLKRNRFPMQGLHTGVGGKTNFDEDIYYSCIREVKEETGFDVDKLKLRGILKTILHEKNSSWILFIYTAEQFEGNLIDCDEGELKWIPFNEINSLMTIGFIKKVLPYIFSEKNFIEGTFVHNMDGNILDEKLNISNLS